MPSEFYSPLAELKSKLKNLNKKFHSNKSKSILNNQSGFLIADFLFAFVLVISCGILIFGFTFSLAMIEISQYIVWSTARNYSVANISEDDANKQAIRKFNNLSDQFPLLTGRSSSPWFILDKLIVGDLANIDTDLSLRLDTEKENKDGNFQARQPWIGAKANIEFKLLQDFRIPFLGRVAEPGNPNFSFPIRAFILRHPSVKECQGFFTFENRFTKGIQNISGEDFGSIYTISPANLNDASLKYVPMEDNGC